MNKWQSLTQTVCLVLITVLLAVIAVTLLLWDGQPCGSVSSNPDSVTNSSQKVDTKSVKTMYGKLQYSAQLDAYYDINVQEKSGISTTVFNCDIGGVQKELFFVCIGDGELGDLIGYIDDNVPVSVLVPDNEPDESWTQEQIDVYYSMLDDVNVVIDSITDRDDFVSV